MHRIGVNIWGRPDNGGSYQYTLAQLKALSGLPKDQYDLTAFFADPGWETYLNELGIKGVKLVERTGRIITFVEHMLWRYNRSFIASIYSRMTCDTKSVRKHKIELLITGSSIGSGFFLKTPTVVPVHDIMHRYEPEIKELHDEYAERERRYSYEAKHAEIVLVDSNLGKKQYVESYKNFRKHLEEHVEVLPFIPPTYIYEDESVAPAAKLPDKYLFYPAQFWTHKNHLRLLQAIKKLKDEGLRVELVLCGSEQNNLDNINSAIDQMGIADQVTILGYVKNSEMRYLYEKARALVYPTLLGPTNIPPLEAFFLGCPVLSSDVYAMKEQLQDAALFFDPRDVDSMADSIKKIWTNDDLCKKLIEKGKEKAASWGQNEFDFRLKEIIDGYFERK